ncbi:IclR family transcriptional regulator [Sedimentibacter sp. B4]|uniref:IclR family transcriptional regulator n=1 Tax=Sedimentibacter sp. B4 TaxID=304766 RepID=UPI0002EF9A4B|nr:IclR family transcriptional regulator [Sedimentibacter sp. B4]
MSETIVSVERAIDVILALYNNGKEMGITELSRELGLHKSSVHRILVTLENKNFVYKNHENDRYWLGNKLFAIGLLVGEKVSIVDMIRPYAKELFNEYKEVVNVSILDKDISNGYKSMIILKEFDEKAMLSVHPNLGSSTVAYASSVGKCLLAYAKNIDYAIIKNQAMIKFTDHTITGYDELIEVLKRVKEQGYAIDDEEQEIGLTCIGAPILDKDGFAIAAISISGPSSRMRMGDFNEKILKVKNIADKISFYMK